MNTKTVKDFDKEAAQWDANPGRVKLASDVATAIIKNVKLKKNMAALDFGCGTGLLTLKIQPFVKMIMGVDTSHGMLNMLQKKIDGPGLTNVSTQHVDFEKGERVDGLYDLIISSMVLHHISDTAALFKVWRNLLQPNGQICFADLDTEDGEFHGDNTGVHHFGFDREKLKKLLVETGYCDVRDSTATIVKREIEGKPSREFPIFLITATRE